MRSFLDDEIQGDWNNLKGTEYHFVFVLWLLLRRRATSVAFFKGNDLLAQPILPPLLASTATKTHTISLYSDQIDEDVWIQLKATEDTWTLTKLLKDNLIANFIWNALFSQKQGRLWKVQLVTQGPVHKQEIMGFVTNPDRAVKLKKRLTEIILSVQLRLEQEDWRTEDVDAIYLNRLALTILSQLADTKPIHLETLKAEIEAELAYLYPDREMVSQIANIWLGALLQSTGAGPANAQPYTVAWLSTVAGRPIQKRGLLDHDPIEACSLAVQNALPAEWQLNRFATRSRLQSALHQFLKAQEPLFVLVGASGVGKSWGIYEWAVRGLVNKARIFIPGSDLDHHHGLAALIAGRLRPIFSADWNEEQFLKRILAMAGRQGVGPLVVIIDDLLVTTDKEVFRRKLARLVQQCAEHGAKLVFTCQEHTWNLNQLHSVLPSGAIFQYTEAADTPQGFINNERAQQSDSSHTNREGTQQHHNFVTARQRGQQQYSFLLGDLTDDEMAEVIKSRLSFEHAERAVLQLRAPAFLPLRNPYLLERYIAVYGNRLGALREIIAPVEVDALLDDRVEKALADAARIVDSSLEDIESAFTRLIHHLWETRPTGLSYSEAVGCLDTVLPNQGASVLAELRRLGLLTPQVNIRLAEPPIANRLFARRLLKIPEPTTSIFLQGLRPEEDVGVVRALLRSDQIDPVLFAEHLLGRDERWHEAVVNGLSECSPENNRVVALLATRTRPRQGRILVDIEACTALGRLAARGSCAWKWAAAMYLSADQTERFRGEQALAAAITFIPEKVAAALRLRLARSKQHGALIGTECGRWLHGALNPLYGVSNTRAADHAQKILQRYCMLIEPLVSDVEHNLIEDIDSARGFIAASGFGEETLKQIFDDIHHVDAKIRYRAARSLRPVVFNYPEQITTVLAKAIQVEQDVIVLNQFLWISYRFREIAPGKLFDALEQSKALDWTGTPATTSVALSTLGDLAHYDPQRVLRFLSRKHIIDDSVIRSIQSEILAYAWWACSEYIPEARVHLEHIVEADLSEVPEKYRVFALRGAVIAQLALNCLGHIPIRDLVGHQISYDGSFLQFVYVDTSLFVRRYAHTIVGSQDVSKLISLVFECIGVADAYEASPLEQGFSDNVHRCEMQCLEILIALIGVQPHHTLPLLKAIPGDWQFFHVAGRLLQEGHTASNIVEYIRQRCLATRTGTINTLDEVTSCLSQVARHSTDPRTELRIFLNSVSIRFWLLSGQASILAAFSDAFPDLILELLDEAIQSTDDLPILHYWFGKTLSWRGLLISRVYMRMFDLRPIKHEEAQDLCRQMLSAVQSLPPSSEKQTYENVYTSILSWLDGTPKDVSLALPSPDTSPLQQSHRCPIELLQRAYDSWQTHEEISSLHTYVVDRRSWWETNHYTYRDGVLSGDSGFGTYSSYTFPAARLAITAIGIQHNLPDPVAVFTAERYQAISNLKNYHWVLDSSLILSQEQREEGLQPFVQQVLLTPNDERVWEWIGHILLLLGRLLEAEEALQRCLSFSYADNNTRGLALYTLACVYARIGQEDNCRQALIERINIGPVDKEYILRDSDFESVRNTEWFKELLNSSSDTQ